MSETGYVLYSDYKQDLEKMLEFAQRAKSNTRRIEELERNTEAIQDLARSVALIAENQKRMADDQNKISNRLDNLEDTPRKRWDLIITAIISTLVSALITALVVAPIMG